MIDEIEHPPCASQQRKAKAPCGNSLWPSAKCKTAQVAVARAGAGAPMTRVGSGMAETESRGGPL